MNGAIRACRHRACPISPAHRRKYMAVPAQGVHAGPADRRRGRHGTGAARLRFHLFAERATGQNSVIYQTGSGYRLAQLQDAWPDRFERPLRPPRPWRLVRARRDDHREPAPPMSIVTAPGHCPMRVPPGRRRVPAALGCDLRAPRHRSMLGWAASTRAGWRSGPFTSARALPKRAVGAEGHTSRKRRPTISPAERWPMSATGLM